MSELSALIGAQLIGVLVWSSILNAPMLQWRARKLRSWAIEYKRAYLVSIKAGLVGVIIGDIAVLSTALSGNTNERTLNIVGLIFGIGSWWFAHSNALLKLADPRGSLTVKDARSISTSVIGYVIGAVFALGVVLAFIIIVVSSIG